MSSNHTSRWVYLIGSHVARPVKIGVAKNPEARVNELLTGSPVPLHLIWKTRGGRALERGLHEYFVPYRLHGEWFDFGGENPTALVASAAALMGFVTHPERVAVESRLRAVHGVLTAGEPTLINHLIKAAAAADREVIALSGAFACLAEIDTRYRRAEGESDRQYETRAGMLLANALKAEGVRVNAARISATDGRRYRGYRLVDLQAALTVRFEGRSPSASTTRR